MTNSKMTKRALFTSIMALMLCFAMLTGTTFAWFTDQETSANNQIIAGNLDIEMYNALTADDSKLIGADTKLFEGIKLEPGAVVYENITVANKGNLALKYQLSVNFTDGGLANALKVAVVDGGITTTDRAAVLASIAANAWMPIASFTTDVAELKVTDETDTYGIVIYWEPSANDNDHNGKNNKLDIGLTLFATQLAAEKDAFDENYDKDAVYAEHYASTAAELVTALEEGGVIALMNDIDLAELASTTFDLRSTPEDVTLTVPAEKDVTIDLNGFTLSSTSRETEENYNMFDVRGVLTLKNGKVVTQHAGVNMGWGHSTNVANVTAGGVLNVENAELRNLGGSDMAIGIHLNNWGEVTLNIDNSIIFATYTAVRVFNSGNDMNNVNITNSTLAGNSQAFWVHNATVEDFGTQEKADKQAALINSNLLVANPDASVTDASNINAEANNTIIGKIRYGFTNGAIYYANGGTTVANSAETLGTSLNNSYVILDANIADAPVATTAPYGNKYGVAQNGGVLDGNGNVLDFDSPTGDNYGIMTSGGTIKNVTVGGVFRGIMIMNPTEDVYIDNVVIDDEDVCYAINTGEGDGKHSVIVTNSTIKGWTSVGDKVKSVSFTNCVFGQGTYYTNVYGRLVKPYVNAVFKDCEFNSKVYLDLSALIADNTVTLENCTVNGVKLTAENWKDLIAAEDICGEGQMTIEGRDGSYMTASNIFDYVIIK